jgi:hypothetical protein
MPRAVYNDLRKTWVAGQRLMITRLAEPVPAECGRKPKVRSGKKDNLDVKPGKKSAGRKKTKKTAAKSKAGKQRRPG